MTGSRSKTYLILLRGINVGGKNTVSMATLKQCLEAEGFSDVSSFINSGNIILKSEKSARAVEKEIETLLPKKFKLDSELIRVLALTQKQLEDVVKNRPKGFGSDPKKYYSDAIFLMGGVTTAKVMPVFDPREGVDKIWKGKGVVYSQRLGSKRTKSRLSKITQSPLYKSMTIRSWSTTVKLLSLLKK